MKLVTHNGRFHYDEILSTAILLKLYPDAEVVRTRDDAVISQGHIVYDVGGEFDPERKRFDHHQPTFFETFSPDHITKLSSSGLVFKYFHEQLLSIYDISPSSPMYDTVVKKAYNKFFLYADALDNGCDIHGEIASRTIADLVGLFNLDTAGDSELEYKRFYEALEIVSGLVVRYMDYLKSWSKSYEYVEEKIRETNGPILLFQSSCCGAFDRHRSTSLILDIEVKYGKDFKFTVFPHGGMYKVLAIPKRKGSYETKNPLKAEWGGLRDGELSRISGIEGCVFVHVTGFIGLNKTLENALRMCKESLLADIPQ